MPIQGIAFDLEGTVIDVEALHHTAHLEAAAHVGVLLTWQEALERLPHFIGGTDEEVAAEIASLAKGDVSAQAILHDKQRIFETLLQKDADISPREGFHDFLQWVENYGLRTAIGTVTRSTQAKYLLQRSGLLEYFGSDRIVVREDVSSPKPHPDVYLETAQIMHILPQNQLVFEDSVIGLQSALTAGCRLAAVPTVHLPGFVESLYQMGAEEVFKSWTDADLKPFILRSIEI